MRRLKTLLQQAQKDLEQKDSDIVKLTKEVVELRLYKAALSSPEERSNSSDAVTVRENQIDELGDLPDGGLLANHVSEMTSSYTDSGHYDDYTNSSIHSKDSVILGEDFGQSVSCCNGTVFTRQQSLFCHFSHLKENKSMLPTKTCTRTLFRTISITNISS